MKLLPLAALTLVAGSSALAQAQPAGPVDILGNWKIVGWTLPEAIPVSGYVPTLKFAGTGNTLTVAGKVGCNYINGPVTLKGSQLTFGVLISTRVACSVAVGQQETALINALSGQTLKAVRVADSLTLTTLSGAELNIRRSTVQTK